MKNIRVFFSENFQILEVKFSIYQIKNVKIGRIQGKQTKSIKVALGNTKHLKEREFH